MGFKQFQFVDDASHKALDVALSVYGGVKCRTPSFLQSTVTRVENTALPWLETLQGAAECILHMVDDQVDGGCQALARCSQVGKTTMVDTSEQVQKTIVSSASVASEFTTIKVNECWRVAEGHSFSRPVLEKAVVLSEFVKECYSKCHDAVTNTSAYAEAYKKCVHCFHVVLGNQSVASAIRKLHSSLYPYIYIVEDPTIEVLTPIVTAIKEHLQPGKVQ